MRGWFLLRIPGWPDQAWIQTHSVYPPRQLIRALITGSPRRMLGNYLLTSPAGRCRWCDGAEGAASAGGTAVKQKPHLHGAALCSPAATQDLPPECPDTAGGFTPQDGTHHVSTQTQGWGFTPRGHHMSVLTPPWGIIPEEPLPRDHTDTTRSFTPEDSPACEHPDTTWGFPS